MKWKIQWSALLCLLLFGCSHPVFIVERPVDDPYVVVVKLSDAGLVEQEIGRIKLPYAVAGKSGESMSCVHHAMWSVLIVRWWQLSTSLG